jgi:hypothetical protein
MNKYSAKLIQASLILGATKAALAGLPETINFLAATAMEDPGAYLPFHGRSVEEVYFSVLRQAQCTSYSSLYIIGIMDMKGASCYLFISLSLEVETFVRQISIGKGVEEKLT